MRRTIFATMHPEIYQGYGKQPPYFEGWYFKCIDVTEQHRYAVIPGIFRAEDSAQDHAFIQVLDGTTGHATYHEYPVSVFRAHEERFEVCIGDNLFSRSRIRLNINDEQARIHGDLWFENIVPWRVTPLSPGIMGWFGWIPFMECYHGIVSLDHVIRGALSVNGQSIDFDEGRGYIEKDWGQNFPSGYVWQQTNHFDTPGTSLTASIAMIPFKAFSFPGFIIGLWHYGTLYRFATYTGAVTENLRITDDHVFWTVKDRHHRLEMRSTRVAGGLLKAPIRTEMHKRVDETIRAEVEVQLTTSDGKTVFAGTGRNAGLEVHGELTPLVTTS